MAYYLDLFSPETYKAFSESPRDISGFRPRQRDAARTVNIGDKLVCYVTRISRWVGVLEVTSPLFEDSTPRFYERDDPFVIRFKVRPAAWLPYELAIPIHEDRVWNTLSFTRNYPKTGSHWTGFLRSSLRQLKQEDGESLEKMLLRQAEDHNPTLYPLTEHDRNRLRYIRIRTQDNIDVTVTIPDDTGQLPLPVDEEASRKESKKIQALIAEIGERMGFTIWIPKSDRSRVVEYWKPQEGVLLDRLPFNYDETTIQTIERIDVIWLRRRSIVRAFEVEHTTSIFSGILRMADLMALQPNLDIHAHVVAPVERKDDVFEEIQRPVFTLLEKGPLSRSCSFISYDALRELANQKHLVHMTDSVIEEYAEKASEEL
ncbi:MAG: hypothetical protein KJ624_02100 [Chloroflexi bacterium]|nr:hypothetical protein [Chloroflexota bacterium]